MINFVPCGHRVIIKQDPVETKTESGIIIKVDEKVLQAAADVGTLIAVGPDAFKELGSGEPWAKPGDRVGFVKYSGKVVEDPITKENYLVCNDEDIVVNYTEAGK
jgi:co-chaperonin GroES (HSP10)